MGMLEMIQVGMAAPWPPPQWQEVYDAYAFYGAWYAGSSEKLANTYATYLSQYGRPFYERISQATKERGTLVHVPVAGDIASLSSSLLFAEEPALDIAFADPDHPTADEQAAQARLEEILEANAAPLLLRSAADSCSPMGGVFLKINVNREVDATAPILTLVHADAAFPEFAYGRLAACNFWTVDTETESTVTRLVERYERGRIISQRYQGNSCVLGEPIGVMQTVDTRVDALLCEYVPNLLPNRLFRNGIGQHLGRSDLAGIMPLMDSLDEIYTDWLRDIQLAKGRIIGSEMFFKRDEDTGARRFDIDTQAYMAIPNLVGSEMASLKDQLLLEQFAIRADEHEKTFLNTLRVIYALGGYAFTSSGLEVGGGPSAESGTALKTRDRKSFVTRNNKAEIWECALERFLRKVQLIDAVEFGGTAPKAFPVEAHLTDTIDPDPLQLSQSLNLLSQARAASTQTLVMLLHPSWPPEKVDAEVQRIQAETGQAVLDPLQIGRA